MADAFPVIFVIDSSALLDSKTQDWQGFSQIGTCLLPQVVWETMQFLCDRAVEPEQERIAREFSRFYAESGWQTTDIRVSHPALKMPEGSAVSKAAQQAVAVAQCAYGLAEASPDELVVLVANNQPLLQNLSALQINNLCGITLAALLQWSRTQQRPPAVMQQIQAMQKESASAGTAQTPAVLSTLPKAQPAIAGPASATRRPTPSQRPGPIAQVVSGLIALIGFAIVGLVGWRLVHPASFQQFWQKTGLPGLPGGSTSPKSRSAP